MNATIVAVDLANNIFEIAAADADWRIAQRSRLPAASLQVFWVLLLGPTATLSTYKRLRFAECSWIRISNPLTGILIAKREVSETAAHEVLDGTPLRLVRKGRCREIS